MIYLDTSVLVPYYCPEPDSGKAEKIIIEAGLPAISNLTVVELASAVSRKIREACRADKSSACPPNELLAQK